ncbi:MAG: hypothetical protein HKN84_05680 [Gammaproteobacteria bacterium]|nr:hypothetical protein [Gammaproteobacteria bacterium]
MRSERVIFLLAASLLAVCASAHHASTGRYDPNTFGTIEGEITDIFWRNPHVRFLISRTNEAGQVEEWEVEFGSVNTVERLGVSRDAIAVGDRISVYGRMGGNGLTAMFARDIVLDTGEELPLQADPEQRYGMTDQAFEAADNADEALRSDIFRVWVPVSRPRTGFGAIDWPLTEAGRAAKAAWDPENDPALRCIPPGLPTAMDNPYPVQFVDRGDTIAFLLEEWDGERTIYLNGTGAPVQPYMGRSVGRWEGDTLVVRTTDIDWRYLDDLGTPQSEDVVIDERFWLSNDGTDLFWEATITDPVNFTEPVVMEASWTWVPGNTIKPFDCALPEATE